jgi:hypothetical protein
MTLFGAMEIDVTVFLTKPVIQRDRVRIPVFADQRENTALRCPQNFPTFLFT